MTGPVGGRSTIPSALARSWLLVPACDADGIAAAEASSADAVILDLEDGTPEHAKDSARDDVVRRLQSGPSWVRINAVTTTHWRDDVDALRGRPGLAGVVLAESSTPRDVDRTAAQLGAGVPVVPLIESAAGLESAKQIAAVPAVVRLAFGLNDFRRDTGIGGGALALAYVRSQLVLASHLAGCAPPIDGPTMDADPEVLARDTAVTADMGMTGKLALHPAQTAAINSHLSPGADEIAKARELIARLGADGSRITDGSDRPRLARAQSLLEHARDFGLTVDDG
ncbi:HpcH/HpaI aldolase/citrate lyase family protein [Tomitella gaofuii]|uniref:HpcH/HpaI aldolase/citrate lyase family protein n=1 Tax=Tomitella gaofuii TaxID=2760083 RepID=UPI0015FACC82|nr:CoA ester lyase [Tomitella gaofuii]